MRQNVVLVALSALTVASAQNQNFTIDPNTVEPSLRADWCSAQYNSCNSLCGSAIVNDCNSNTLKYNCTCANGTAPGLDYYIQTIPFFVCDKAYTDCIAATDSQKAQDECKTNIKDKCGKLDPAKAQSNSPSDDESSSSAGPAPTQSGSGSASQNAPSSSSSTAAAAATSAAYIGHGVAVVAAGLFAAML